MSTATSKRPLDVSNNATAASASASASASAAAAAAANKKSSSSSKKSKPLDKEARLKRTQQNRAAQRAFRERKERKMQELEIKVAKLNEIQKQNEIESNFLKDQLNILLLELKKYRPATNIDSKVLNYLSQHNSNKEKSSQNSKYDFNFNSQTTPNSSNNELTPPMEDKEGSFDINEPVQKKQEITNELNANSDIEDKIGNNWLDNILSDNDIFNQQLFTGASPNSQESNSQISYSNKYNDNKIISSDSPHGAIDSTNTGTDFDNQFDEQVANFCVKMNQACGTKSNPVPRNKSATPSPYPESITTSNAHTGLATSVLNANTISPQSSSSLSFASTPSIYSNFNKNNSNNNNNNKNNSNSITSISTGSTDSHISNNNNNLSFFTPPSHTNTPPSSFSNFGKNNNLANSFDNYSGTSPQLTTCSTDTSTSDNNSRTNSTSNNNNDGGKDNYDLQFLSNDFKIPFMNPDLAFPTSNDNDIFFRDTNPLTGNGSNNILDDFIDEEEEEKNNEFKSKKLPTTLFNEVPYTVQVASDKINNLTNEDDDDLQIVPSKDGKMLKCSEIWDRITTHPKYSDLDIDGLCGELMAKAKCSERGVVVDADEVHSALTKHMQ